MMQFLVQYTFLVESLLWKTMHNTSQSLREWSLGLCHFSDFFLSTYLRGKSWERDGKGVRKAEPKTSFDVSSAKNSVKM